MGFEELKHGNAKRRPLKRRNGEAPPPLPPTPPAPVADKMRVRVLKRVTSRRFGNLFVGEVYEFPVADAKDLISMGIAEQDKMLDAAPETK